jgi:hypothetical protein
MHIENLVQFIVPLTFLAIWALTSLFNREAHPLPQRVGRPQPPGGPGLGAGATVRSEALAREANLRWASPTSLDPRVVRRPTGRSDEEILIIEETRRPSSSSGNAPSQRASTGGGARRGGRARPVAPAPKRPEPAAAPRPLSGTLSSPASMGAPMNRPLELNPLSVPASPLMASDPRDLARTVAEPTRPTTRPAQFGDDYKLLVSTPAKLREAILVSEILRPPLALRRRQGI